MTEVVGEIGYGTTVEISTNGGDTWTKIDGVGDVTPPPFQIDNPETPYMEMPNRAVPRIPGVLRMGQTSFPIKWKAGSAADTLLRGLVAGFSRFMIRETWPNGAYWTMTGLIAGYAPSAPVEGECTATVTLDVSGVVTHNAAAAPTNEILPAISGVLEVDEVLTAWPGQWAGGPSSFAYQWKNADVAINGATGQTYTVVAGDATDAITVEVTATNSAGSASATSAPVVIEAIV